MPTDEQRALWAAIRDNTLDDTPRLVFADWLQENGDEARAEFIRMQCRLAQIPKEAKEHRAERGLLTARSERLLAPNRRHWTAPLVAVVHPNPAQDNRTLVKDIRAWWFGMPFFRGFARPSLFLEQAVRVIASETELEPLGGVSIFDSSAVPHGSSLWLHAFEFGWNDLGLSDRRAPDPGLLATLAGWTGVPGSLALSGLSDEAAVTLARMSRQPRWESVSLTFGAISDTGVRALAASPFLGRTIDLDLSCNRIGDDGAVALAASPHVSELRSLFLHNNRIGDAGAAALAASPYLTRLEQLILQRNGVGPDMMQRIRDRFGSHS